MSDRNDSHRKRVYSLSSGRIYDEIYLQKKDYKKEALQLFYIIAKTKQAPGSELLSVACGTGNHLVYLQQDFKITGIDNSKGQLKLAREKLPKQEFILGDMTNFDLGKRRFDVIECMFGSIAYSQTLPQMQSAVKCMAQHLKPGGVLIIDHFFDKNVFQQNYLAADFVDKPDLKLARLWVSDRENDLCIWDLHFLVATPQGVKYFTEEHKLGMFSRQEYIDTIETPGLKFRQDSKELSGDYDWLVAVKPGS